MPINMIFRKVTVQFTCDGEIGMSAASLQVVQQYTAKVEAFSVAKAVIEETKGEFEHLLLFPASPEAERSRLSEVARFDKETRALPDL